MVDPNPLQHAIGILQGGGVLSSNEMTEAFRLIMGGRASDGIIGAFLGILSTRIPTGEELFGATKVMRECVDQVVLPHPETLLDTCGTGGAPKTFNVSTAAGIVAAACGVRVAKHGNRSRTGRGSAELLDRMGINIEATINQQKECLKQVGICFCFAPRHHKAVAHVMPVRKELPFPTIFNLLGPLTNPCSAGCQLLGVWDDKYVLPMAKALQAGGTKQSAVVHSTDGLDEISISASTRIVHVSGDSIVDEFIHPVELGLQLWELEEVTASDLDGAVELFNESLIVGGRGAPRDMVLLNSAVGLFIAGRCKSIADGLLLASNCLDSGRVSSLLKQWAEVSHTHTLSTGE